MATDCKRDGTAMSAFHPERTVRFRPIADIARTRHHPVMSVDYFLPKAADVDDLSAWSDILPVAPRILRSNLFGDAFLVDGAGAIHMLEWAACTVSPIASSEEQFWREVHDGEGWQLRPLVDECRRAGKVLKEGQCYAFTTPPLLGGEYAEANVWVAPWREWFGFTADLFQKTKDLPNGMPVCLRVTE